MTVNHRREIRRFIFPNQLATLRQFLENSGYEEVRYSDNSYTQTIYFSNQPFFLPFNLSMKLRRYISSPQEAIGVDSGGEYLLENKSFVFRNRVPVKFKTRRNLTGQEALDYFSTTPVSTILDEFHITEAFSSLNKIFDRIFLSPQIATQYKRSHFVLNKHLRVTIDEDFDTFFSKDGRDFTKTTQYDIIPVEIKIDSEDQEHELDKVLAFLDSIGSPTAISKKNTCLNSMHYALVKNAHNKIVNKMDGSEIESKYIIQNIPEGLVFLLLRNLFENDNDFFIAQGFSYTSEIASIHRYYRLGDAFPRIAYSGAIGTRSVKGVKSGNDHILKRNEKKDKTKAFSSLGELEPKGADFLGEITRIRRAFWVIGKEGRIYKVAVDLSYTGKKHLGQVEIEYSGTYVDFEGEVNESVIRQDIRKIGEKILSIDGLGGNIIPTKLTKLEWLLKKE